jgi:hypothetical protein
LIPAGSIFGCSGEGNDFDEIRRHPLIISVQYHVDCDSFGLFVLLAILALFVTQLVHLALLMNGIIQVRVIGLVFRCFVCFSGLTVLFLYRGRTTFLL